MLHALVVRQDTKIRILEDKRSNKKKTELSARFFHCDLIGLNQVVCFEIVNVVVVEFYAVGVSAE